MIDSSRGHRPGSSIQRFASLTWLRFVVLGAVVLQVLWIRRILPHANNSAIVLEGDAPALSNNNNSNNTSISGSYPHHHLPTKESPNAESNHFWNCTPTHHACDDYQGILHIESGDFGGAGGTIFFQFVVGQLIYADQHNLLPFIHFDNFSHLVYDAKVHGSADSPTIKFQALTGAKVETVRDPRMYHATYPGAPVIPRKQKLSPATFSLYGTGVWNHYFAPVSDFCPGDYSCSEKPLIKMERAHVSPGLHLFAPWAPKIWRYSVMPDHIGQPHIPLAEWVLPQRRQASAIVQKYYRFQPSISEQVNQEITSDCLGLHVRWSDKGVSRRRLGLIEFLPFVQAYIRAREASNARACIYLATDAQQVVQQVHAEWPADIVSRLILSRATVRSPDQTAVFDMDSHHLTNLEVLRDILELSRCGFLLHGNSAVSESAIYLHSDLIYQSVNLEDPQHPFIQDPRGFEGLVYNVSQGIYNSAYWNERYTSPRKWFEVEELDISAAACKQSGRNATLDLSPRWLDSFIPINRWVTLVFVKLWQKLAFDGEVVVDSNWYTWFDPNTQPIQFELPCILKFADVPQDLQDTIQSFTSNQFFDKRFKSVIQEDDNGIAIRQQMHRVLDVFLKPRPHIVQRAEATFHLSSGSQHATCLGIHIPDPGYRRKDGGWIQQKYPRRSYQDYIVAFVEVGGTCLYLATDSHSVWEDFVAFTSNQTLTLYTQADIVRNRNHVPAHYMEESIQRLGSETLVDIWNLKRCGVLIHGYGPISEAALFWNPSLKSILMPDQNLQNFTSIVRNILA